MVSDHLGGVLSRVVHAYMGHRDLEDHRDRQMALVLKTRDRVPLSCIGHHPYLPWRRLPLRVGVQGGSKAPPPARPACLWSQSSCFAGIHGHLYGLIVLVSWLQTQGSQLPKTIWIP